MLPAVVVVVEMQMTEQLTHITTAFGLFFSVPSRFG